MECKIPYIFNSNISDSEKQRLNLIHLEVFSRAKNSGAFRQFNNKLYSIKNKYNDSLKFVNSINEENKQIIAKLNQSQPGQFYLSVNTLPLANQQGELFFNIPTNQVNFILKSIEILQSPKADEIFRKGDKNNWSLDKILQELQVPKEQQELIKSFNTRNREEILTSLLANYSYTIEINTSKGRNISIRGVYAPDENVYMPEEVEEPYDHIETLPNGKLKVWGVDTEGEYIDVGIFNSKEDIDKEFGQGFSDKISSLPNTQYYSNLTVPGGTNYTENEIATPAITPSIKGHAQFNTDKGIGWFRSDEQIKGGQIRFTRDEILMQDPENPMTAPKGYIEGGEQTKTRRILEVQSDLFQKGRSADLLAGEQPSEPRRGTVFGNRIEDGYSEQRDSEYSTTPHHVYFTYKGNEYYIVGNGTVFILKDGVAQDLNRIPDGFKEALLKKREEVISEDNKNYKLSIERFNIFLSNLKSSPKNQFLQLLNKDNNWVTFFIKSIIQDSAKKGYEKVLFPTGNTASKVEGHTTLEEFKKQKEKKVKELETLIEDLDDLELLKSADFVYSENNYSQKDGKYYENYKSEISKNDYDFARSKAKFNYKIELNSYKQELERVEKEGFAALRPIYKFYEEVVGNILKKNFKVERVKDEYGNEWNEIKITPEMASRAISLQIKSTPGSEANEDTLKKVKEVLNKMGVSIEDLVKYAKSTGLDTTNINGVADLTRGIIAVAQGKENTVLTEEMVHIASSIIEQKNSQLITALISKIDRFKIFKATLDLYKGNKNYQLPNGKPDIRKIKKEAVDKLIAEVIINQNEGTTEYPELLQEENRSLVRQWWDAILDFIRGIYTKANIDLFEEVGKKILTEDIGTVNDLKSRGLYFNLQDDLYNTIVDRDARLKVIPATETKKRHYLFDNKEVASTVTEKIKKGNKFEERSSLDKENDEIRREFGDRGHIYIRNYIEQKWLDEKGYKLDKKKDVDIESGLPDSIREKVEKFADNLISSYPEGTRFLLEKKVINERVKGGLASAIDFIAIKPNGRVDILDWKFTSVNKEQNKDIPFYKQSEWKEQMKEYVYILKNYGLKEEDIDKARMIPLIIDWKYRVPGDKQSGLVPKSIEIADVNNPKETELYLLPVPSDLELTKNKEVDKLLASLDQYYEKLYKKPVEEKDRPSKLENLAKLAEAIRRLHVQLDFNPLLDVITQFMKDASKTMSTFSNLDFEKASKEEIQNNLTELLQFKNSALKFADLDEVYLGGRNRSELTEGERKLIDEFATHGAAVRRMLDRILELEKEYIVYLASKEGISKEAALSPELEIKFMGKTFMEWSDLPSSIINLGQKLLDTSKNEVDLQFSKVYSKFSDLLLALEKTIKNPFEAIGNIVNGELKLKYKLDKSFLDKIKEAKSNRDKKYLLSIIDKDEFKRLADAYIKEQETIFNERHYSSDEKENESKRKYAIKQLKDSIDIDKESFTGYNSYQFNVLLNKTLKEEGHYSKEYQEMAKNQAALDMWNFFTEWNDKAKQMGYLTNKGLSFFPLIEATITQKLANTDNLIKELGNVYKDLYQIRLEEEQGYGKIDPETGKLRKEIPKFYTKTNKEVYQLSKDLNKIGALWIKALLDYQANSDIKDTLLAMYDVEKSKGNIVVSGGEATIVEGENANAPILQNMIDDGIFMIKENLNSVGNLVVSSAVSSLVKDKEKREEKVTSFKKGLRNADKLTQSLAVGWKLLVTIPNYFGTNFQSFINSGNYYTFSEYLKNQATILNPLKLSDENKALINAFIPLTESITLEERRKLAKKQGIGNYLSTWSFHDVMMATNSYPDKLLQLTNALSILKNTIVIDGKIYNARQYLKVKDRERYKLGEFERKEVEKSFNERLNKLIEDHSIEKLITKDGDIQGVSNEEVAKYRAKILDHARKLSGQVSENNKADYRRDTILKSFMMFKNWIPKQISLRTLGVRKSLQSNDWEYGRTRAFVSTAIFLGIRNIGQMRDIIKGTDKGLKILDEMLKQKKEDYFLKNGKHLEITNEEFYDLMRSALRNQMKENIMLISLILMLVAVRVQKPPEDESDKFVINRWKSWMKAAYKISDELFFYYNPLSFEEMTRGSVVPSLGLLTKSEKFFKSFAKEMYGEAYNDQDIIDKNYPLKYFLDLIPGPSQFDKEILPLLSPSAAQELGIKLTENPRATH